MESFFKAIEAYPFTSFFMAVFILLMAKIIFGTDKK